MLQFCRNLNLDRFIELWVIDPQLEAFLDQFPERLAARFLSVGEEDVRTRCEELLEPAQQIALPRMSVETAEGWTDARTENTHEFPVLATAALIGRLSPIAENG
jgi:hypothetical protein